MEQNQLYARKRDRPMRETHESVFCLPKASGTILTMWPFGNRLPKAPLKDQNAPSRKTISAGAPGQASQSINRPRSRLSADAQWRNKRSVWNIPNQLEGRPFRQLPRALVERVSSPDVLSARCRIRSWIGNHRYDCKIACGSISTELNPEYISICDGIKEGK